VSRVAVASTSAIAIDAAREVADAGGNAVDCALASAIMAMNTEPGVCALAGGAYVTVWAEGHGPVTFDGNHAVPGRGLREDERGKGKVRVRIDYGGGISTIIGPGSVAIPGALAAVDSAWRRFGSLRWDELFRPTIDVVRSGFPLPAACHYYLGYSAGCCMTVAARSTCRTSQTVWPLSRMAAPRCFTRAHWPRHSLRTCGRAAVR
jgi:gamma-glutamyltranspeptidase/glutathione hydrolase